MNTLTSQFLARLVLCAAPVLLFAGCNGGGAGGSDAEVAADSGPVENLDDFKEMLNYIVESGEAGSALGGMPMQIEQVQDEAKRKALTDLLQQLESANTAAKRKSIAKSMLEKL